MPGISASADLGLGTALSGQVDDETEEEKKRRLAGQSPLQTSAARMLLGGYGNTGVAAARMPSARL